MFKARGGPDAAVTVRQSPRNVIKDRGDISVALKRSYPGVAYTGFAWYTYSSATVNTLFCRDREELSRGLPLAPLGITKITLVPGAEPHGVARRS